jgi:L-lactate dehydrogenase complex protein LldG
MSGRENILRRVRAAVARPASKLFERNDYADLTTDLPRYPPMTGDFESLRNRFAEELTLLRGEFLQATDGREANLKLRDLVTRPQMTNVAVQDTAEMRCLFHQIAVTWLGTDVGGGTALARFDLGVTHCDALVARTGSVVLTAQSAGGRALSVLPPNHLVIARKEQLVADLSDALKMLQTKHKNNFPSFMSVVSGPSRTSDIEKMLVLGAHGPKRLFVLLVG